MDKTTENSKLDKEAERRESFIYPLIHEKLSLIASEMDAVGKSNQNRQQGWSFRSIDQLKNASSPLFRKHQVYYTPEVLERTKTEEETSKGTKMNHFEVRVKFTFYAVDGSNVSAVVCGEAADSGDKGLGKAQTYAEKMMLIQVLNIPTEDQAKEDPDFDEHTFQAPTLEKAVPSAQAEIQNQPLEHPGKYVIKFGKHKDKTLESLAVSLFGYKRWCEENIKAPNMLVKEFYRAVETYGEHLKKWNKRDQQDGARTDDGLEDIPF